MVDNLTADHIGYTVEMEEDMIMSDTEKLQAEYVEVYNRYMSLPNNHSELGILRARLQNLEETLTRRFLFESGYTTKIKGDFCIYVKE